MQECLDEIERLDNIVAIQQKQIERLMADRDHWRNEYKTLELASEELVKQNKQLRESQTPMTLSELREYNNRGPDHR